MRKWEKLPRFLQTGEVYEYYAILKKKKLSLFFKRVFDISVSFILLILLLPVFLILAVLIKISSRGPVFYRQERVTRYGKRFRIHKFRTMVTGADKGSQVTVNNDSRVTKTGKFMRKFRLDEISQLIDILQGNMTFVGTRPEVPKYVERYNGEMLATLLLPAGVTSLASIYFKDEADLLGGAEDADRIYVEEILPQKMYYNLKSLKNFSFWNDIKIMFMTVFAVLGKNFKGEHEVKKVAAGEDENSGEKAGENSEN
jgi:lipopolysaccharide/colanic/teichoic acid biosynthesis glycosyltransferase